MQIRQSDLASFARCAQQKKLADQQRDGLLSQPPEQLSMTAYGSVIHHAMHVLEKAHAQKIPDPLGQAIATFEYYWDQRHIEAICPPVTIWAARDTHQGYMRKGVAILRLYYEQLKKDTGKLLALEYSFTLPYLLDGVEHTIHGTIDRLSVRKGSQAFLNIEDYKSGQDYISLRHNLQFTMYALATTYPAFWGQFEDGDQLYHRFRLIPRRGTWISLRAGVRRSDAGYRGPQDFARLEAAMREYVKAHERDVFPLNLKGDTCRFCPFQNGLCGGVPVPAEDYGRAGVA